MATKTIITGYNSISHILPAEMLDLDKLAEAGGAAEVGVYLSAGVLYYKPGSSYTGKMSSFSKIAKA